jgi:membrane protein DedA with SNARE-associated domain
MPNSILSFLTGLGASSSAVYISIFGLLVVCGLGVPLPEDITLLASGYLAAEEIITLPGAIGICMLGVLVGDSLIFAIGRRYGAQALDAPGIRTFFTPKRMERSQGYFIEYGKKVVFFGRFIAGMRAPIFLIAGIMKMPYRTFILLDGIGALLSVPLLTWLGWHFADDIHEIFALVKSSQHALLLALGIGLLCVIILSSYGYIERLIFEKSLSKVEERRAQKQKHED